MSKKLTKELINSRLLDREIQLIGKYVNMTTKTLFRCNNHHEWESSTGNIIKGRSCPKCHCNKLTNEIVNSRLIDTNITMIDIYVNSLTKALFRCSEGHEWMARPSHVSRLLSGCPHCSKKIPWTKKTINDELKNREIEIVGNYSSATKKTTFRCYQGHQWEAKLNNILHGHKTGCPHCSEHGFNPSKPAYAYVLKFDNFIKYGISNSLETRLNKHKLTGFYEIIIAKHYNIGQVALNWENEVKKIFGGKFATQTQCPDGYTETLSTELLEDVHKLLLDFT
jgi:hypothetical protein